MGTVSENVATWKSEATETLDVRPVLAEGGEPFVEILEAAERMKAGQSLVLIAPFEPAPLYSVLDERGFSHATERVSDDEWVVRFTRKA